MDIKDCRDMVTDFKIQTYERKLEKVSNEIDILANQIENKINGEKEITLGEISQQLREIQDFINLDQRI